MKNMIALKPSMNGFQYRVQESNIPQFRFRYFALGPAGKFVSGEISGRSSDQWIFVELHFSPMQVGLTVFEATESSIVSSRPVQPSADNLAETPSAAAEGFSRRDLLRKAAMAGFALAAANLFPNAPLQAQAPVGAYRPYMHYQPYTAANYGPYDPPVQQYRPYRHG